ncbi:MAG: hypothetical protein B6I34_10045 [Anaerolineaceae bacterium 4572_32.1]|nr:MAG: hypothetical protein B6I34_10045 [Anaerolineaceae bacterium 4572_32.1]
MIKIKPQFEKNLRADPSAPVAVLVTANGPPDEFAPRVRDMGLEVHRKFKLRRIMALRGPANAALALLDEPWVISVEEDQPITTMGV